MSMLPFRVYLDENVPHSLYGFLLGRGIAVTTAQGQQTRSLPDDDQLRFAAAHGLVLLTTNVRHFHRWHQAFRTRGEEHGGMITVPQDDQLPERLHVRSALLIAWAATFATTQNALFRWMDLQTRMYGGYVPGDYRAEEIDLALGRAAGKRWVDSGALLPHVLRPHRPPRWKAAPARVRSDLARAGAVALWDWGGREGGYPAQIHRFRETEEVAVERPTLIRPGRRDVRNDSLRKKYENRTYNCGNPP